jgi:hypothetical protein
MGRGTDVSNRVRAEMRAFHRVCNSDHSGHVIPNELGGAGEEHNLFIQSANVSYIRFQGDKCTEKSYNKIGLKCFDSTYQNISCYLIVLSFS